MDSQEQATRKVVAQKFVELADTDFFKALGEPARVQLLAALIELGPSDISTLAERFPQDRSVISRHLSLLESCGMVSCSKEGRHRFYAVNGQQILQNIDLLSLQIRQMVNCCC